VRDHLFGIAAVARGEGLPLALGRVQRLRPGDAFDPVQRPVRGEEVRDLALERDLERVLLHGGLEPSDGGRPAIQQDGVAQGGGAGLRDAHRLGGDAIRLGRGELVAGREAPGAVHEDAHAEALALAGLHPFHARGLDVDRLLEAPDHAHVRIRGTERGGRVEGTVRQVSHRVRG
jgi:hypothetical protein